MIDRTTSTVPLAKGPVPRATVTATGCSRHGSPGSTAIPCGKKAQRLFSGDVLVAICPSRSVSDEFRRQLEQYVDGGGKLLVIDSPENANSTANSLLWPFGMSIHHDRAWKGR